ncbi:hypothetical protein ACFSKN_09995 [Mariniflexile gromovii]|uniref:IrrE N-terminal-like domain-containing protein n=1 Tax=Mariniflexile gromovii TaxID=362523 RepID=A0ABS4BXY5_9FLAO|nr:hypothetical protein [Mariniflexile gromovii]MBP0905444.1 hypothetical protein [Mariniflexile gromovii]
MDIANTKLIDERNQKIWNDLNKTHSVTVEYIDSPNYSCFSANNNSTIFVSQNNIDINSFTHELLHILIRQKEIYFGASLSNAISGNPNLNRFFSDGLIEHFGNCMEHIKMLPIYLELGFDKKKFIIDYEENKCTKAEVQNIKSQFKTFGKYNGKAIDYYIAKYIAVKADPKKHLNYEKSLKELNKIDPKLFQILEKCVNDWKNMPIDKVNIWDEDYISISFNFCENLEEWGIEKNITESSYANNI